MTEEYQEIQLDSSRNYSISHNTVPIEIEDVDDHPLENKSNADSDENLTPTSKKNILVKIKFSNGAILELPMSERKA